MHVHAALPLRQVVSRFALLSAAVARASSLLADLGGVLGRQVQVLACTGTGVALAISGTRVQVKSTLSVR